MRYVSGSVRPSLCYLTHPPHVDFRPQGPPWACFPCLQEFFDSGRAKSHQGFPLHPHLPSRVRPSSVRDLGISHERYVRARTSSSRDRGREPKCLVAHRTGHACTPMGGVAMPGGRGCDARTCLDDLDASLFPADETMRPALWVQGPPSGSPGIFSRPLRRGCVTDGVEDCVGTSALLKARATFGRFWCVARHEWQTSCLILRTHHP